MSSNVFSRFLNANNDGSPSIYETIRQDEDAAREDQPHLDVDEHEHDQDHDQDQVDEHGRYHDHRPSPQDDRDREHEVDEENLQEPFRDEDIGPLLNDQASSRITTASVALGRREDSASPEHTRSPTRARHTARPKWMTPETQQLLDDDEDNDDVPASLLYLHDGDRGRQPSAARRPREPPAQLPSPVPGPASRNARVRFRDRVFRQARADDAQSGRGSGRRRGGPKTPIGLVIADPAEKAMWRWTNVENLDDFLLQVYDYFDGKGFWSIILQRVLFLLTGAFVVGLSIFLTACVDYRKLPGSTKLEQILVPECTRNMSGFANLLLWIFSFLWFARLIQYALDGSRLWHMRQFYVHLLGIPDHEMQTITWQTIVGRLMDLREANPRTAQNMHSAARDFLGTQSKQRMDAHDIANRLMRRENYLIALFNKDILNLSVPLPFLEGAQFYSRIIGWSINLCVVDYVFNEKGQVKQTFLKDSKRRELIEALQRRFIIFGILILIFTPFHLTYLIIWFFLRYFTEFQKNPAQLGSRAYTPYAEWKFREFNELWHMFKRRLDMSHPFSTRYIDQFPKDKTVQLAQFVSFVSGALAAVLGLATVLDPDLFLGFEITHDRTAFFYLTIFVGAWAFSRGLVHDENLVFDPEFAIKDVIHYTHYEPAHWEGRLHTDDVRREFSSLYQTKVMIFVQEIMGVVFCPFMLWFSLPTCADRLVDFFREFTIHVDGLGYVCSFALFDFKSGGVRGKPSATGGDPGTTAAAERDPRSDYYSTKDGKMLSSYFSFIDNYGANGAARNAAAGARGHRRPMHLPPTFPGLQSSHLNALGRSQAATGSAQLPVRHQPSRRSPAQGPSGSRLVDPSPSLLLDPHHQPSVTLQRQARRARSMPRHRPRAPDSDVEEEESQEEAPPTVAKTSARADTLEVESRLGDSWKVAKAGAADSMEDDLAADSTAEGGGGAAGVLGLLYQFQRAQGEKNRVGGTGV